MLKSGMYDLETIMKVLEPYADIKKNLIPMRTISPETLVELGMMHEHLLRPDLFKEYEFDFNKFYKGSFLLLCHSHGLRPWNTTNIVKVKAPESIYNEVLLPYYEQMRINVSHKLAMLRLRNTKHYYQLILRILKNGEDPTNQVEIAKDLGLTKQRVSYIISRLLRMGAIVKHKKSDVHHIYNAGLDFPWCYLDKPFVNLKESDQPENDPIVTLAKKLGKEIKYEEDEVFRWRILKG